MKKLLIITLIGFQLFILSGCWGARLIQSETIVTGLGVDFKNGEYSVYIQALNFSNIAKQEGGTLVESPPILIGEETGKSIASALNSLEQKSTLPLYFGHVISIILSKSVIDEKLKSVNDFISNRSLLRYNTWIFGTDENIKDILLSESFFNLPSLYTVVATPQLNNRKNLTIPNLTYQDYISRFSEPVGSILIPSLKINDENFEEKVKKKIAAYNGVYVLSQQKSNGFLSLDDIDGLKWLNQVNETIPVNLNNQKVGIQIKKSKARIKLIKGKKPEYEIDINARGIITENENQISLKEIIKNIDKKIKNEVLFTIKKGDELNVDLLNVSEKAYRFSSKYSIETINDINEKSIKDIDVTVNIAENQSFK